MKLISGKYFFPTTVCAGFLLVFSLWVVYEFIASYTMQRNGRQKLSNHMANIVAEVINCELRQNNGKGKKLNEVLRRIVDSGTVQHIRIESAGKTIIAINNDQKYQVDFGPDDYHLIHDTIIIKRKILLNSNSHKPDALLIFAFDSSGCFADIDSRGNLLSLFYLMGCVCISLLFLAWSYSIRNRELQDRLQSARDKSEHVDELGLAAAGLAHETKNPLGIIRGLAQNIADNKENSKKTRTMARDIMEETDVTTARLGDFLSYAKIRSPKPVEINTIEYIERIISLVKDDFDNAGVELVTAVETPSIYADQDMLSQILMNLLTNSLRFTDKGGKVSLSVRNKIKTAELKVEDTGSGIPENILPIIFKPYVTSSAAGYGIGLAIVKRITEQSGWNIKIDSMVKKGTTITISNIKRVIKA